MATKKARTMDLKGNQYAKVKDRLQEFRRAHPRALIETKPEKLEDGEVLFRARILSDKADPNSAEATGHALGNLGKGEKSFEKLETIAVGRALALLGYASDGEIASSEEMEEFERQRDQKRQEMIMDATEKLTACKSLAQLKKVWASLPVEAKQALEKTKEDLKKRYENA